MKKPPLIDVIMGDGAPVPESVERAVLEKVAAISPGTERQNPRFVWCIGAISERFPDVPDNLTAGNDMVLWDRQEKQAAMTIHNPFAQAMCLETVPGGAPFTDLEEWMNSASADAFESEGIPATREEFTV